MWSHTLQQGFTLLNATCCKSADNDDYIDILDHPRTLFCNDLGNATAPPHIATT